MKRVICIFLLLFCVSASFFANEKVLSENEYPDFIKEFIEGKPYVVYGRNNTFSGINNNVENFYILQNNPFDIDVKITNDGKIYTIYLNYKCKTSDKIIYSYE
nr:hypothetical protein [Treponema sp.]